MDYLNLKRRCELEQQIQQKIFNDNQAACHFDYQRLDNKMDDPMMEMMEGFYHHNHQVVLTLITFNPKHKELFTLYTTQAHPNEIKCLDEVLVYLNSCREKENGYVNYEIVWFRTDKYEEKFTSYFTGKNYKEIIDRFFENKDPNDFVVVSSERKPYA